MEFVQFNFLVLLKAEFQVFICHNPYLKSRLIRKNLNFVVAVLGLCIYTSYEKQSRRKRQKAGWANLSHFANKVAKHLFLGILIINIVLLVSLITAASTRSLYRDRAEQPVKP